MKHDFCQYVQRIINYYDLSRLKWRSKISGQNNATILQKILLLLNLYYILKNVKNVIHFSMANFLFDVLIEIF